MSTEYKMTWRDNDQRWTKIYKGRQLYFPGTGGKKASYPAAWKAFQELKARIDAEQSLSIQHQKVIEEIKNLQSRIVETVHDNQQTRDHWKALETVKLELMRACNLEPEELEHLASQRTEGINAAYQQLPKRISVNKIELEIQATEPTPSDAPPWADDADNLQKLLGQFLTDRKRQIELGQLSMARYDNQQRYLKRLIEFLGPTSPLTRLNSPSLSSYRDQVLNELAANRLSSSSARDRLQAAKQLVEWAYHRGALEDLPRCLAKGYSIAVTTTEPKAFSREEVEKLYSNATDRQRLYLLLGINCAFTSADLGDLEKSEIDFKEGTITRKRSKTKRATGAPVVVYRLWEETRSLLRQELAQTGELALVTANGKPLVQETWRTDGSVRKNDTTHSAWVRLQQASGIEKPHKLLRKTGATLLNQHEGFARFVSLYLAHSPRGMAEQHYAQADQAGFQKSLEWLREQFNFEKAK